MNTNNNMQNDIDAIFESVNTIKDVKVSPFFKDKTLERLFAEKEEKQRIWSWFTPQLQFAVLACFLLLNTIAFVQINSATYDDGISEFAEIHGLSSTDGQSLFN